MADPALRYPSQIPPRPRSLLRPPHLRSSKRLRSAGTVTRRLPQTASKGNGYVPPHPSLAKPSFVCHPLTPSPADGSYSLTTIDEFADQLLNEERVCEIILPRLTQRRVLEETEGLAPRRSRLGRALGVLGDSGTGGGDGDGASEDGGSERGERYVSRSPSRSVSPEAGVRWKREESFYTEGSEEESEAEGRGRSRSRSGSEAGRYVSRSPEPAERERMEVDA